MKDPIHVIGCGAVGSNVALLAAKMGWTEFVLWDADSVESHNLPNQAYSFSDIGSKKVDALERVLTDFNPAVKVVCMPRFFEETDKDLLQGKVIIATDSMKSRQVISDCVFMNTKVSTVLEARLGFDYGELFVINPIDYKQLSTWQGTFLPDDQVKEGPCNQRICTTLVAVVSSTMVHYLCIPHAVQRGDKEPVVPFATRFMLIDELVVRQKRFE